MGKNRRSGVGGNKTITFTDGYSLDNLSDKTYRTKNWVEATFHQTTKSGNIRIRTELTYNRKTKEKRLLATSIFIHSDATNNYGKQINISYPFPLNTQQDREELRNILENNYMHNRDLEYVYDESEQKQYYKRCIDSTMNVMEILKDQYDVYRFTKNSKNRIEQEELPEWKNQPYRSETYTSLISAKIPAEDFFDEM